MADSKQNFKSPPVMREGLLYSEWKKELEIWSDFTELPKLRQGGALFLTLTGKARQAVLANVPREEIKSETGLDAILKSLDELYAKDISQSGYAAFDDFTNYRRSSHTSIQDYLVEFNIKYSKLKDFKMTLPEGVLAYYVLRCANLTDEQINICRATCPNLTYKEMKAQIEKVTSTTTSASSTERLDEPSVPISQFYGYEYTVEEEEVYDDTEESDEQYDAFYAQQPFYNRPRQSLNSNMSPNASRAPRLNPLDEFGNPTRCSFCHSTYHWVGRCPDAPRQFVTRRVAGRRRVGRNRGGPSTRGRYNQDNYL